RAEMLVAVAFLVVAVALAVLAPGRGGGAPAVALLFTALYAVTSRIEFDVAAGYGMPTQLVLVPMLYAVPPGWVPLLVAGGFVLGKLPSYVGGSRSSDRVIEAVANSWHAVGPAAVFVLAGVVGGPRWSQWPVL